jgi:hypothetical protein
MAFNYNCNKPTTQNKNHKMKKIIFIKLFALAAFFVKAQNNLQFSQVLTYSGTAASNGQSISLTVPSGKVWKIETIERDAGAYLNFNLNGKFAQGVPNRYPIWLKAGDVFNIQLSGGYNQAPVAANYWISIIEFNVVS